MPAMAMTLTPTPLMRVFHFPIVEVDCGNPSDADIEKYACAAFFMWQVDYPEYSAKLSIQNRPAEQAALNRTLFRKRGAA